MISQEILRAAPRGSGRSHKDISMRTWTSRPRFCASTAAGRCAQGGHTPARTCPATPRLVQGRSTWPGLAAVRPSRAASTALIRRVAATPPIEETPLNRSWLALVLAIAFWALPAIPARAAADVATAREALRRHLDAEVLPYLTSRPEPVSPTWAHGHGMPIIRLLRMLYVEGIALERETDPATRQLLSARYEGHFSRLLGASVTRPMGCGSPRPPMTAARFCTARRTPRLRRTSSVSWPSWPRGLTMPGPWTWPCRPSRRWTGGHTIPKAAATPSAPTGRWGPARIGSSNWERSSTSPWRSPGCTGWPPPRRYGSAWRSWSTS